MRKHTVLFSAVTPVKKLRAYSRLALLLTVASALQYIFFWIAEISASPWRARAMNDLYHVCSRSSSLEDNGWNTDFFPFSLLFILSSAIVLTAPLWPCKHIYTHTSSMQNCYFPPNILKCPTKFNSWNTLCFPQRNVWSLPWWFLMD